MKIGVGLVVVAALALAGCGGSSTQSTETVTVTGSSSTSSTGAPTTAAPASAASTTSTAAANTTSSAPPSGPLPIMITKGWSGSKPSLVDFSGDAGNVVTGISWQSWADTGAIGEGTSGIQSCVPNCAQGQTKMVPTTLAFSDPQNGHFTHVVETRNGTTLSASYGSLNWPISAER